MSRTIKFVILFLAVIVLAELFALFFLLPRFKKSVSQDASPVTQEEIAQDTPLFTWNETIKGRFLSLKPSDNKKYRYLVEYSDANDTIKYLLFNDDDLSRMQVYAYIGKSSSYESSSIESISEGDYVEFVFEDSDPSDSNQGIGNIVVDRITVRYYDSLIEDFFE